MLLVGSGFFVYCIDVLRQTTRTYGGLGGALGWRFLLGRESEAPPARSACLPRHAGRPYEATKVFVAGWGSHSC